MIVVCIVLLMVICMTGFVFKLIYQVDFAFGGQLRTLTFIFYFLNKFKEFLSPEILDNLLMIVSL